MALPRLQLLGSSLFSRRTVQRSIFLYCHLLHCPPAILWRMFDMCAKYANVIFMVTVEQLGGHTNFVVNEFAARGMVMYCLQFGVVMYYTHFLYSVLRIRLYVLKIMKI